MAGERPRARPSAAGGFAVALGSIGGFVAGARLGQASAGFLIGLAVGVAVAVGIWLLDRRRA